MHLHDIAFYAAAFFLAGVIAVTSGLSFPLAAMSALLLAVFLCYAAYAVRSPRARWLGVCALALVLGAGYAAWHGARHEESAAFAANAPILFSGVVHRDPVRADTQELDVMLEPPYRGMVRVSASRYPEFFYGDTLRVRGVVRPLEGDRAGRLRKDGIVGTVRYAEIERVGTGKRSPFLAGLFALKRGVIANFERALGPEQAAFLAGITLGERGSFDASFQNAMAQSGTTHLVALSGYNISVIAVAVSAMAAWCVSRRWAFALTLVVIAGFVCMTGAEASVVRAALMGGVLLLAKHIGRVYSVRNAIAYAALLMAVQNPLVLRFDVGFELSFLALLGIVYLAPALKQLFRLGNESGILSWRENIATTIAAELAVTPLLLIYFGRASMVGVIANVLLLGIIPFTMALGFMLGLLGFFSHSLALLLGAALHALLAYELWVIQFFGSFGKGIQGSLGVTGAAVYYAALVAFVWYGKGAVRKADGLRAREKTI